MSFVPWLIWSGAFMVFGLINGDIAAKDDRPGAAAIHRGIAVVQGICVAFFIALEVR